MLHSAKPFHWNDFNDLKWFQWFSFGERFLRAILESDSPTHTNAGRRQSAAKTPKKQLVSSQWALAGCLELINCNYHLIYYARIRSHTFKGLPLGKVLSRLIIPFGADRIAVWLWFHCDVTAILLRSHFRLTAGSMRPHSGEMILVSELQSGNRTSVDVFPTIVAAEFQQRPHSGSKFQHETFMESAYCIPAQIVQRT